MIERVPVTVEAVRHVVLNMRERDHAEIYALRWDDDPEALVQSVMSVAGAMCCVWTRDAVPATVQGVVPTRPGVWEMFAFGTEAWPKLVLAMTKHARRFIMPALRGAKAHRVECRALATHTDSRKWLAALGARQECVLAAFGRNAEDFVSYVWRP